MFCVKCGKENSEGARFCRDCGTPLVPETPHVEFVGNPGENVGGEFVSPVLNLFGKIFTDKLFLVICILVTVSAALPTVSSLSGGTFSVSVIAILETIFLWLIYSAGKKGTIDVKNMRRMSGCVYAEKIVDYVISGILALSGVLLIVAGSLLSDEIAYEIEDAIAEAIGHFGVDFAELNIPDISGILFLGLGIALLISAVLIFLIGKFGMGSFHKLAKSSYESAMDNRLHIECAYTAKTWCMIYGIFTGISAIASVGNYAAFLSGGSGAAACIIGYVLIGKYLENTEQTEVQNNF